MIILRPDGAGSIVLSPMTNEPLAHTTLTPNKTLRAHVLRLAEGSMVLGGGSGGGGGGAASEEEAEVLE